MEIGVECDDNQPFLTSEVENLRIFCCCQAFVAHVDGFNAFVVKMKDS